MAENFTAAAKRHWNDARYLEDESRVDNADHLYGFATECALKSVLMRLGAFDRSEHLIHINGLWRKMRIEGLEEQFPEVSEIVNGYNVFDDWSAQQRYEPEGTISYEALERHRNIAQLVLIATGVYRG